MDHFSAEHRVTGYQAERRAEAAAERLGRPGFLTTRAAVAAAVALESAAAWLRARAGSPALPPSPAITG